MSDQLATLNPQPRMAAFKIDLFNEIDDLKDQLDTVKIQKILLILLNVVQFAILLAGLTIISDYMG